MCVFYVFLDGCFVVVVVSIILLEFFQGEVLIYDVIKVVIVLIEFVIGIMCEVYDQVDEEDFIFVDILYGFIQQFEQQVWFISVEICILIVY